MHEALEKLQLATVVIEKTRSTLLNRLISGSIPVGGLAVSFPKNDGEVTSTVGSPELAHA